MGCNTYEVAPIMIFTRQQVSMSYIYIYNTQFTFNLRLLLDFPFRKFISVSARSRRGAPFVAESKLNAISPERSPREFNFISH